MGASVSGAWLLKGHFDFAGQDQHNTTTLSIKANLCSALGLQPDGLGIANYPTGPSFKHTFWWREGDTDYAEAQFVAAISKEHPILSLGVSVEKGLEDDSVRRPNEMMDRHVWDWPRFIESLFDILSTDVPRVASAIKAPVHVRIRHGVRWDGDRRWWATRCFSFAGDQWFERHAGRVRVGAETIVEHVRELDARKDSWAIATITQDFGASEADGMSPGEVAAVLLRFDGIRRRMRIGAHSTAV